MRSGLGHLASLLRLCVSTRAVAAKAATLATYLPLEEDARGQREAANTSWHGPVWASAPLGLRRGARANPVGVKLKQLYA